MRTPRPDLSYWRTTAGQEVDFVLEAGRSLLPIEVKAAARPIGDDIRGLESFLDLHPEARLGIVACGCWEPHMLSRRVAALPFETLLLA
jgi:predicted AAA+ superfamily ATPase